MVCVYSFCFFCYVSVPFASSARFSKTDPIKLAHQNFFFILDFFYFQSYMSGGGYVLSMDLAWVIGNPPVPYFWLKNEDVATGLRLFVHEGKEGKE